jgi:hypothetical protein
MALQPAWRVEPIDAPWHDLFTPTIISLCEKKFPEVPESVQVMTDTTNRVLNQGLTRFCEIMEVKLNTFSKQGGVKRSCPCGMHGYITNYQGYVPRSF